MLTDTKSLRGRDYICLHDFSTAEVRTLLDCSHELKSFQKRGDPTPLLSGRSLAIIFHKPSLRTRVSFEVAMTQLGGHALHLTNDELGFGERESVADIARVLSGMVDGIMIRTFSHAWVLELAQWAHVPVVNGLDDLLHPTQALADIMTVEEKLGSLKGVQMAYVGDGNNVAHSLMFAAAKTGMNLTLACPHGYDPDAQITALALQDAKETAAVIRIVKSPQEGVAGADVIYSDVWTSMGQEAEKQRRLADFGGWMVDMALVRQAKPGALVMHCLPAHRGEEITDEVMESSNSVVFCQAENRLHAHKGILAAIM